MKFGGIHIMQLPRPWSAQSERTLLNDGLDIVELSDKSGFDYVWATEHHFLEEYSHASSPELFLAAASQRTKHLRLAHGIIQTPPLINHPARVAERIAALDLLSNGRVEFGMGSGATTTELGGFVVPQEEKKAMQLEGMSVAVRMLVESPFTGHEGKYVKVPPAQRAAEAAAEATPSAVDGVFASRIDSGCSATGAGRADVFIRQPGRSAAVGARLLRDDRKRMRSARLRRESKFRDRHTVSLR